MLMLDEMLHVDVLAPLCPWCEEPLCGTVDGGLHQGCAEELAEELEDYDATI